MIRIDAVWLAVEPIDMRAGAERLLASVVRVFGAARRLNKGSFEWPRALAADAAPLALTKDQFDALALGLPWQRLEQMRVITRL